jgi:hypothetical protein
MLTLLRFVQAESSHEFPTLLLPIVFGAGFGVLFTPESINFAIGHLCSITETKEADLSMWLYAGIVKTN